MSDDAAVDIMEALHSCLCCMRRAPDKDLKTPYTHLGYTEIYLDMLAECFNIQLNDGGEECGICSACVGRLRDASAFKLQVQRSQAKLQARLERALQAIVNEEIGAKQEVDNNSSSDDTLYEELTVKSEVEGDNGTSEDWCFALNEETATKSETAEGETTGDLFFEEPPVKAEVGDDGTRQDLVLLARAGAGRADAEPARPESARAREQLGMACAVRLERLRGSSLRQHQRVHTGDKRYTCNVCDKRFTRKSTLITHIRTHTGQKPYTCDVCSKTFSGSAGLWCHRQTHTGLKPYTCDTCQKQFTQKCNLIRHIKRGHTGKSPCPHTCDVCGKTFVFRSRLREHQRIHTGLKPYTCNTCQKQFTQKRYLNVHIRTHTGWRPYTCDVCSKTFICTSNLRRHQRIYGDKH